MSDRCSSDSCLNGNCEGCKGGVLFCEDPRCYPDCEGCPEKSNNNTSDWILITIILVLAGILLVLAIITGFDYWNQSKMAAEPKNITYHKHVKSVIPTTVEIIPPSTIGVTPTYMSTPPCPPSSFSDFSLNSSSGNLSSSQVEGYE